ncbi:MAG TPA: GIY-YIG nuclease family protein [Bacillus sp. (in: firmicutes)]|uniref:GIY-YIG nuclease family protein n=1 Tax=Bacillus litorisediminis TaxID=2922713 RepID=UPI001FAEE9C7|nr:GIY-YIG nuclease family protein [Bacillus litorisediminis]HWO76067.1 GIY-YIG nuclease family protein [Bacillus sp. (in: firmicutes)]
MEPYSHFIYVLECADGSYYTGYSTDVKKRVSVHNAGKGAKYTRSRLPVTCIYKKGFETKREALREEYAFKRLSRKEKERFLKGKGEQDDVETEKL